MSRVLWAALVPLSRRDRLYVGGPLNWPCGLCDGSVFSQMTVDK